MLLPSVRRLLIVFALGLTSLVASGTGSGPASAVLPGTNGKIAFVRAVAGYPQIFTADANGSNAVNVSQAPAESHEDPEFSPDGTKIAYLRLATGGPCPPCLAADIWVMDADGGNKHNVSNDPAGFEATPTWSPDGSKIAYGAAGDIWVMDAATGNNKVDLTTDEAVLDAAPAWSPDGSKIAYARDFGNPSDIWVMNATGGTGKAALTPADGVPDTQPAWSPDGTRIAYQHGPLATPDIWVMNANGSSPLNLTNNAASDTSPAWSPDGTLIAFTRQGTSSDLLTMDSSDGQPQTPLIATTDDDFSPTWATSGAAPATCGGKPVTITGTAGNDKLRGTAGDDVIAGLGGADYIYGYAGNDTICGGDGVDSIDGGFGADWVDGGPGIDEAKYYSRTEAVSVSLDGAANDGNFHDGATGHRDNVRNTIENVVGTSGNDVLAGNSATNRLYGVGGDDVLYGNAGNDYLNGGTGADKFYGGYGNDYLNARDYARDKVIDGGGGTRDGALRDPVDPAAVGVP